MKYDFYKLLGILFCTLMVLPYVILGQDSFITIHDYLDSSVAHIVNEIHNCHFIDFKVSLPLMDGNITQTALPFFSPTLLVFKILPPYWAIVVHTFLVKVVAFGGLYLLLTEYLIPNNKKLSFVISILYCYVPFYVDYGISSAGIPLLTYALVSIYKKQHMLLSYGLIFIFVFYSSFVLSGVFVCFLLFVSILLLWVKNQKLDRYLLFSFICISVAYLIRNWSLIDGFFFGSSFISHRAEFIYSDSFLNTCKSLFLEKIFFSQYHAGSFFAAPILLGFLLVYFYYRKTDISLKCYFISLLILELLVVIGQFVRYLPAKLFVSFQFDRFYFLYPALCFVLLAKACEVLTKQEKKWTAVLLLILSFAGISITNTEFNNNIRKLMGKEIGLPSYAQFYDQPLFSKISNKLNIPLDYSTKVASVGLFPAIAEYNGLWCVDSYSASYSLEYKHKFRKVIEKELDKRESLRRYFDEWGSRCYLFSAELDSLGNRYLCGKNSDISIGNFDINTKSLKELGCQLVFSAVEILNSGELNMKFKGSFSTDNSYWKIWVYELL